MAVRTDPFTRDEFRWVWAEYFDTYERVGNTRFLSISDGFKIGVQEVEARPIRRVRTKEIDVHRLLLGYPLQHSLVEMELLTGAGVGSLLGFAVGHNRASSELRAGTIEDQRDAFLLLNRLLRHHILNSMQLIDGDTARLADCDDPDLHQIHEVVRTRSQEVTSLRKRPDYCSHFHGSPANRCGSILTAGRDW